MLRAPGIKSSNITKKVVVFASWADMRLAFIEALMAAIWVAALALTVGSSDVRLEVMTGSSSSVIFFSNNPRVYH